MLAAGILALYPLLLALIRKLPAHEYAQAVRAPAWFAVVIGGAIAILSLLALRAAAPQAEQVFLGLRSGRALLMADAYALWASALLGAALCVTAWVPAARRTLVPHSLRPFLLILVLLWLALLWLFSLQLTVMLFAWLGLLVGVSLLWYFFYRPRGAWHYFEVVLVLGVAAVIGTIGLLMLQGLGHGVPLSDLWAELLAAPPGQVNAAVLCVVLAWLGPAVYLPWWLAVRRDEPALVWMPAAMLLAVGGMAALVRLLFFAFPMQGMQLQVLPGFDQLALARRVLDWLLIWALIAVLVGAGWLVYQVVRAQHQRIGTLRPLVLVSTGLLMLAVAVGVRVQSEVAVVGLLWMQLAWTGGMTIWLAAGGLLPALTAQERQERTIVTLAAAVALAGLLAVPPSPGYWALANLWGAMAVAGVSRLLMLLALIASLLAVVLRLRMWLRQRVAASAHPGAGWGILGPFLLAALLLAAGLFAPRLQPLLLVIRRALLQID